MALCAGLSSSHPSFGVSVFFLSFCERLRCEPWRPCSQKNTTPDPRRTSTDSHVIHSEREREILGNLSLSLHSRPRQKGKHKTIINQSKVVFGKRHRQNKLRQSSHKIESPKKSQTLSAQSSSRGNVLRKKLPRRLHILQVRTLSR